VPKKKLIIAVQSIFLFNAIVLAVLVGTGLATPWSLLSLAFINGIVGSFDLPARLAYVPELIPKEDLINAISLNSLLFNVARALGPALAALLFLLADAVLQPLDMPPEDSLKWGCTFCFGFNALSYLAVIAALLGMPSTPAVAKSTERGSAWDGFRFVWKHRPLAGLLACTALISIVGWPALTLFPAYTRGVLHLAEKQYSLLVSALGFGALVAALTNAAFGTLRRHPHFLLIGAMLTAVGVGVLSRVNQLYPAMFGASIFGFGMIFYLSTGQSLLQGQVTPALRGRVLALWPMALGGAAIVGHLATGAAARIWDVSVVLSIMSVGLALGTIAIAFLRRSLTRAAGRVAEVPLDTSTQLG